MAMAVSNFSKECKELFNTTNLYSVLSLDVENANSLTIKEIKRAYYKCSLKYHPDRQNADASDEEKVVATKQFQVLGKVYAILSDPEKREVYDNTGHIDDEESLDSERDWMEYWRLLFKKVNVKDIENFKLNYKGSQEELNDLKLQYLKDGGDMELVYQSAFCADSEDDRERIRSLLQQLIDQGELEHFAKFDRQESEAKKKRRQRRAKKEAAEAKEMLKDIMGRDEQEDDLVKAISKRNKDRAASLFQHLEEKYGGTNSQSKKRKTVNVDSSTRKKK